jgi:hypothetical protein
MRLHLKSPIHGKSSNAYFCSLVAWFRGPQWSSTHQCTNVDGWCTDGCTFFVPPCPWANQGGELLTCFIFLSSAQVGFFFLGFYFFLTPHTRPSLTYLPTFSLLAYAAWPPPSPTYLTTYLPVHLPTHLPTYPSTYLLMYLHTKSPQRQWRCKSIRVLQYTKYVASFSFLPTSLLDLATLQLSKTMFQWTNWKSCN